MKILSRIFRRNYPLTVKEFKQLAEQSGYPKVTTWNWITGSLITKALAKLEESEKVRILMAKGLVKDEWGALDRLPKLSGTSGGYLKRGLSGRDGIIRAMHRLIMRLAPPRSYIGTLGRYLDVDLCCPRCNRRIFLTMQVNDAPEE